ncbi:MAG: hypothetical protein VZR11_04585 [Succinimonas sp.]|nr:hypothetical protein [Succinimonas sp.]
MKYDAFYELTEDIIAKATDEIEKQKDSLLHVDFSSSAGFDGEPEYEVSVDEITGFAFDRDSCEGEVRCDVTAEASVAASKYDGIDGDKVSMGTFCGSIETSCAVKYRIGKNNGVKITEIVFDENEIAVNADAQM